jgi:hypothetical protein
MSQTFLAACEQRASDARPATTRTGAGERGSPSPFAQLMALMMAQHPRLGAHSPAAKLTADCGQRILLMLTPALVVDIGSGLCKAGFAGAARPHSTFPTLVGRPKAPQILPTKGEELVGDEAASKAGVLHLKYPVEHGVVCNWDSYEAVWRHVFFDRLLVRPELRPVLLTEPPLNPKANRER